LKVAGYVRVSTKKQKENGNHERQKEILEDWASKQDHDIEIFMDDGISGQKENRKAYEDMMGRVEEFDAVVVKNLRRFGRSLKKMIQDIEKLGDKDVEFISLSENLDTTTAQGKLLFHIMGAFSQFYADQKREETLAMIERRREQGKTVGRTKKLPKSDREEMFEMWKEKNLSYRVLAKIFEERTSDNKLGASTVQRYVKEIEEEKEG